MLRIALLLFLSLAPCSISAQSNAIARMDETLDSLIYLGIDSLAFPGAQILVRHRDSIIYHKTWGALS